MGRSQAESGQDRRGCRLFQKKAASCPRQPAMAPAPLQPSACSISSSPWPNRCRLEGWTGSAKTYGELGRAREVCGCPLRHGVQDRAGGPWVCRNSVAIRSVATVHERRDSKAPGSDSNLSQLQPCSASAGTAAGDTPALSLGSSAAKRR